MSGIFNSHLLPQINTPGGVETFERARDHSAATKLSAFHDHLQTQALLNDLGYFP